MSKGVRAASTQIEARREEIFTTRVDRKNEALFRSGWVCKRWRERGVTRILGARCVLLLQLEYTQARKRAAI